MLRLQLARLQRALMHKARQAELALAAHGDWKRLREETTRLRHDSDKRRLGWETTRRGDDSDCVQVELALTVHRLHLDLLDWRAVDRAALHDEVSRAPVLAENRPVGPGPDMG